MTEAMSEDALFDAYGTVRYYSSNGQSHRVHGPAVGARTGQKFGFSMGVMYLDGSAVKWYIEGVALGKSQFLAKGGVMPADNKCYQQCPVRGWIH